MTIYRSWIALVLMLIVYASLPTGIADARGGGHVGGETGHFAGHPAAHWGGYGGDRWEGHDHWDGRGWGWHGVDVDRWHGGHWFHGDHLGRLGWWWVVGDGWYFYPAPVYPYPDPYVPPAVVTPSADHWYYCPSANAYYPYVTGCAEPWQPVIPQAPHS